MNKTAKRTRLLDYGFVSFYNKRNNIDKRDRITNKKELIIVAKKILEVIADSLIKSKGGVVLDKFGYLCHWMTPVKRTFKVPRKGGLKFMANYHTDSYFYNTTLFSNIFSRDLFKGWSFDKMFIGEIKKARYEALQQGMKYKFFHSLVKRIYTNRFINKLES